ncbi:unnamed protein product [Rhizophagus irregularis]|nr:unnamed protein product [Rhizophagus irregularis]
MYCCQSSLYVVTKPSSTKAISTAYKNCFNTSTRYSRYQAIGTSSRKKWHYVNSGFQLSLLHMYEKKQSIFVLWIEKKQYIVEIYQESTLIKQFKGATLDEVLFDYHIKRRTLANANWKYFFTNWVKTENPIIELEPALHAIYPKEYEFNERELNAWQTILKAVSATNITPWLSEKSKVTDKVAFAALYKSGFLTSIPKNMPNATYTFWMYFEHALANNKKTSDGKKHILSIISNEFTYRELKQNLNVIFYSFTLYVKF